MHSRGDFVRHCAMTTEHSRDQPSTAHMEIRDLTLTYERVVIQHDLTFTIGRGDIFIIMGRSGCSKSTLLKHLIGLIAPATGEVLFDGHNLWRADPEYHARCCAALAFSTKKGRCGPRSL